MENLNQQVTISSHEEEEEESCEGDIDGQQFILQLGKEVTNVKVVGPVRTSDEMLIENLGENWYEDIMNDNEGIGDNYLENLE